VYSGEQEESPLHIRWGWARAVVPGAEQAVENVASQGRLAEQIELEALQPPQYAVVPHVYLLHLRWAAQSLSRCGSGHVFEHFRVH